MPAPPILRSTCTLLLAALLLANALPLARAAQPERYTPLRDLVEQALDQRVNHIQIKPQPLPDALRTLGEKTGLRFTIHEDALRFMPYGDQTQVQITLEDITVRDGLRRICGGLGLRIDVIEDRVHIKPAPVLERLNRRLTLPEAELLQKLVQMRWSDFPREDLRLQLRIPSNTNPRPQLEHALKNAPGHDALQQLEAATDFLGWRWMPNDSTLVFYLPIEDIERRLTRTVDLVYTRKPLDELFIELGRRADITVMFEPGALRAVGAQDRLVDLVQRDTTVRQALELICGNTGLRYALTDQGVVIDGPEHPTIPVVTDRPRVAAILRVPVKTDGTTLDFLIWEDELPPEFAELRAREIPTVIETLRERLRRP